MLIRSLAVVALLLTPVASPLLGARPAQAQSQQIAVAELMRATALDQVFTQFAATIAASARAEEISNDEIFLKHWEATANAVFDAKDLHRRLRGRPHRRRQHVRLRRGLRRADAERQRLTPGLALTRRGDHHRSVPVPGPSA